MSIGIYNPYLDTMSGGEKYILSLALCLSQNHSVTIFWDPKKKDEIVEKAKKRFGMDITDLTFSDDLFVMPTSVLTRFKLRRKYDRVIVLSDGSIPFLFSPLILHFQSPVEWVKGNSLKNRFKMTRVKSVLCNSHFTKSYIDKKFHITSDVLYPPVPLSPMAGVKKEKHILHVGRFGITQGGSSYKKQDVLAQTFKFMVDKGFKGWTLTFIMSVKDEDVDKVQAFEKSLEGYPIKVIVNPENRILWEMYKKTSLYWHASGFGEDLESHPDRAEHFGISTVEAMGMGAVPLTFNAGGQPEIVDDGKNGFLWTTIEELQQKTLLLTNDEKKLSTMREDAQRKAKVFSEESFCEKASKIIV